MPDKPETLIMVILQIPLLTRSVLLFQGIIFGLMISCSMGQIQNLAVRKQQNLKLKIA